uniref:Uncharacterized protein n=1 Tax=Ciona savignyi TaxID=51511 RepID=H2YMA0_CIOSA
MELLTDKIVVGHSLHCDTRALKLTIPTQWTVDVARLNLIRDKMREKEDKCSGNSYSLKKMALHLLGRRIQTNTHCSVEDATATMDVFKSVAPQWFVANQHLFEQAPSYFDDKYWPSSVHNM